MSHSNAELMITTAARRLRDDDSVLVGIGIPNLACNLAKRTHAPNLQMMYESGTVGSNPSSLPLSIGDPVLASGAVNIESMMNGFSYYLQGGHIDVGFLGGAQIDRHGNINSTVIGDYDDPAVRLPGSGGACEIATNVDRTLVIAPHHPQRFPEAVDFITSPGFEANSDGDDGIESRSGPEAVITDLAVMEFKSGEMIVTSLHPGVAKEDITEATGWAIPFAEDVQDTPAPTDDELSILRDDLDPDGIYLED